MIKELDRIYAIRLMHMLLTPFEEQKAFELGLIDEKGNDLRKPLDIKSQDDYTMLHKLAFQLKQIINDLPSGNFRLKKFAVAMAMLRNKNIPTIFQEDFQYPTGIKNEYLKLLNTVIENNLCFPEEEVLLKLHEDGEMNTTAAIDSSTPVIKKKKPEDEVDGAH